jgi:hypothetical protein
MIAIISTRLDPSSALLGGIPLNIMCMAQSSKTVKLMSGRCQVVARIGAAAIVRGCRCRPTAAHNACSNTATCINHHGASAEPAIDRQSMLGRLS